MRLSRRSNHAAAEQSGGESSRVSSVLITVVLIAACATPADDDGLQSEAEADLLYPGSEQLSDGGHGPDDTIEGPVPSVYWRILGSNDSGSEILEFYEIELAARGWEPGGGSSGIPSTSELDARAWSQGPTVFRLAFKDPEEWHQRLEGSDRFVTLYEISLIRTPNSVP